MNQPARRRKTTTDHLANWIESERGNAKIREFAPEGVTDAQIKRTALHLLRTSDENLDECSPESIVGSVLQAYHLGLDLTADEAHLIAYDGECELRPDYKGLVKLAKKTDEVEHIFADVVREGDDFTYRVDLEGVTFAHAPKPFSDEEIVGAYCVIKYETGEVDVQRASAADLDTIKRRSGNPWKDDQWSDTWDDFPGEMAKKAVTRRALKWVDLKPEAVEALKQHDAEYQAVPTQTANVTELSDAGGGESVIESTAQSKPKALESGQQGTAQQVDQQPQQQTVPAEQHTQQQRQQQTVHDRPPEVQQGAEAGHQQDESEPQQKDLSYYRRSWSHTLSNVDVSDDLKAQYRQQIENDGTWDDLALMEAERDDLKSDDDRAEYIRGEVGAGDTDTWTLDDFRDLSPTAKKVAGKIDGFVDSDEEVRQVLEQAAKDADVDIGGPMELGGTEMLDSLKSRSPARMTEYVNRALDEIPH